MIGVKKCIIAVNMGFLNVAMLNPKIVKKSGKYETEKAVCPLKGYENVPDIRRLKLSMRI